MRIVWSSLAVRKVLDEARYIARDRPNAAERWADSIFEAALPLAQHPHQGRTVPELARVEIRELIHRGYRIIYRLDQEAVLILTVRHSRRLLDLSELIGAKIDDP
jgi:plasmid stabilization system protein ParE